MSWLIDNASTLYLLLGLLAAGQVLAWWLYRRVKLLGFAAGVILLMGLVWLLGQFVITDSMKLEKAVRAMADAVVAGKMDDLFKHISRDFRYKDMNRDALLKNAQLAIKVYKINDVRITKFNVDEVSREKKLAKTSFNVSVWYGGNEQPYLFSTQADFVLEADDWKLQTLRFYKPLVDQDKEIDLPFPR